MNQQAISGTGSSNATVDFTRLDKEYLLQNVELMCALSDDAMRRIRDEVKRAYDAGKAEQ